MSEPYYCNGCKRYSVYWDGRARVLQCLFVACQHVIRMPGQKKVPTESQIMEAIELDKEHKTVPFSSLDDVKKENKTLQERVDYLELALFCSGEIAVVNFNDLGVGIADKVLNGRKFSLDEYKSFLNGLDILSRKQD